MTTRSLTWMLAAVFFAGLLGVTTPARAELFDVSPTLTTAAPGIPAGFPLWYQDYSGPPTRPDANPNYGIGPTPGGLTLELCPDPAGVPGAPCISDIAGDEFFWWDAGAIIPVPAGGALTGPGSADLVLATEGVTAATPSVFNRTRIRIDVPVAGTYTVTHPYGVKVFEVITPGIRAINDSLDQGCALGTPNCDFRLALNTQIGPYLFWDSGLPIQAAGGFYIGDAATPHRVLGSPFGTNFFRVDGPPGSNLGGPGIDFLQTDLFTVSGKVFTGGGNTAPVAVADSAATLLNTPVVIDVLANDTFTDVPINPGSITFSDPVGGIAATTVIDGRVRVTFTPTTGFTGPGRFNYTVTGFAGQTSAPATVTVMVEDLKVSKAEFRPKLLKWRIAGTSSDGDANSIAIQSGPSTVNATLSGARILPTPVASAGSGNASLTLDRDSIDFTLALTGLLNITETTLRLGAPDANGPALFSLAGTNVASRSATLTAADLVAQPAQGINSMADAINAILGGRTYIEVRTAANPNGELRGQLGPNRLVGSATVGTGGTWLLEGKSKALPDSGNIISIRSSNGVEVLNVPVKLK